VDQRLRRPRLVGRTRELALLGELLRGPSDGEPAVVALGGDAGCGKTRLLQEFLGSLPDGTLTLRGRCYDGRDPPVRFAPLLDAFRSVPEDDRPGSEETRPAAEVFERALALVERLGRNRLVVVVVEDLHLADRSTLDLFAFLAANVRDASALLVMTWCSETLPGGTDLRHYVAELTRDAGAARIDLGPLDRSAAAELLADAGDGPLDPAMESACWERAEGNPFYSLELLAAARRRGNDPHCPLPDTLADLMHARLDTLGCRARQLVRVAAAAGRRVDHRLLAGAAGMPAEELFTALHEAVDAEVLVPVGDGETYRFSHALLHEAAYAQLLPGERRLILGRAAARLPARGDRTDGIPVPWAPHLTPRELQVLALVASGDSNRDIARELFISEKTASVHVSNILAKLGAHSRTAAAAAAHRLGVLR
jgi:predicted ATPase/DNA-binding CsgD family transcriptional regulator